MKSINPKSILQASLCLLFLILCAQSVFSQCPVVSGTDVISTNTTWTGAKTITKNVYITANTTLTIDAANCKFYTGSIIQLEQFAALIIKNGSILSAYCTSQTWAGIRVIGDPSMPNARPYQGYVEVNNSWIMQADIGVRAYEGGLVNAINSTFRENGTCIQIEDHTQSYPYDIVNCDFLESYLFQQFVTTYPPKVYIKNSNGVSIKGCFFEDAGPYRTGLLIENSNVNVTSSGTVVANSCPNVTNGKRSAFHNLSDAIVIKELNGTEIACNITMTDFDENMRGITSVGKVKLLVEHNNFNGYDGGIDWDMNGISETRIDIYVYNSPSVTNINTNNFVDDFYSPSIIYGDQLAHIYYNHCSFAIDIQKNNFNCLLTSSIRPTSVIYIKDHQNGFQSATYAHIYCNTFNEYTRDIHISNSMGFYIGLPYAPANNIFSRPSTSYGNIMAFNAVGNYVWYYMENPLSNARKQPLNNYFTTIYNADYGAVRSCTRCVVEEVPCPDCKVQPGDNDQVLKDVQLTKDIQTTNTYAVRMSSDHAAKDNAKMLEVFDLSGKRVYYNMVEIGEPVNLSILQRGLYIYKINEDSRMIKTGKLVIE